MRWQNFVATFTSQQTAACMHVAGRGGAVESIVINDRKIQSWIAAEMAIIASQVSPAAGVMPARSSTLHTSHVTGQLTINCCLQASAELQMISILYASAYVDNIDLYSFSPQPKLDWMIISPLESNHCSCVQPISPPLHCTATATNCATDCSMFLQLSHAAIKRRLSS